MFKTKCSLILTNCDVSAVAISIGRVSMETNYEYLQNKEKQQTQLPNIKYRHRHFKAQW
jgi:hypothetical protein